MTKRITLAVVVGALLLAGSTTAWWLWQATPEPAADAPEADTDGLSEQQQREMLQEIGYLK